MSVEEIYAFAASFFVCFFFRVHTVVDDVAEVTNYLLVLRNADIHSLGLSLGLNYTRLKKLETSKTFREDMIAAWLQKEDHVLKKGPPTWETLIKALKHPRVNQTGVADKITAEKIFK